MEEMNSPAGRTERQPEGYLAFMPSTLPPALTAPGQDDLLAITHATEIVGRLAGTAARLPNPDLFVAMYVRKEAILSSRIEGIESTLDEILDYERDEADREGPADPADRIAQVVNYVRAARLGAERIGPEAPITLALIRELHAVLMHGARNEGGSPAGQFRDTQNWIGPRGSSPFDARYVPPPAARMQLALGNLAHYINEQPGIPVLIRCAIAHAQFETIHPFHDGNGRLGRLLIPLILRKYGALPQPLLYLSLFLLAHRREYYDRLTLVRSRGDWMGWLRFFCEAVRLTGEDALATIARVEALQATIRAKAQDFPPRARALAETIFDNPVLSANSAMKLIGSSFPTAQGALQRLVEAGVLVETTGKRRNKRYRFTTYIEILGAAGENAPGFGMPG